MEPQNPQNPQNPPQDTQDTQNPLPTLELFTTQMAHALIALQQQVGTLQGQVQQGRTTNPATPLKPECPQTYASRKNESLDT